MCALWGVTGHVVSLWTAASVVACSWPSSSLRRNEPEERTCNPGLRLGAFHRRLACQRTSARHGETGLSPLRKQIDTKIPRYGMKRVAMHPTSSPSASRATTHTIDNNMAPVIPKRKADMVAESVGSRNRICASSLTLRSLQKCLQRNELWRHSRGAPNQCRAHSPFSRQSRPQTMFRIGQRIPLSHPS
jgi:ribosomal protein L32E